MVARRLFLRLGVAGGAWLALGGHTPYGHWEVYRRKHLLIGACRADPATFPLAQRIVEVLARQLPESSPRASRAPDQQRLASLLASDQMQVIILRAGEAAALADGRDPFVTIGAVSLNRLFTMGEHLLLCRPGFPDRHAWLLAEALSRHGGAIPGGARADPSAGPVPVHAGALAHSRGAPLPGAAEPSDAPAADHGHAH